MEESLTLLPRRPWLPWSFALFLTISVAGVGFGVTGNFAGWIITIASLPFVVWQALEFNPRRSCLVLTGDALLVRRPFRTRRLAWEWVNAISVARTGWRKTVVIDLKPGFEAASWNRRLTRLRSGHDLCLATAYGMSPDALAVLLKRWQARFLESPLRPAPAPADASSSGPGV